MVGAVTGVAGRDECQPVLGAGQGERAASSLVCGVGGEGRQRGCCCRQPQSLGLVLPEERQAP